MTATLILAATALAVTSMITLAASRAWRGWLDYKRLELASRGVAPTPPRRPKTKSASASSSPRCASG